MRGELVAIDLETTGLDPIQDAIIEFGAVRMQDGEIIDEYSTLINPNRPIPDYVKSLTGIRDEDFLPKPHNPGEPAQRGAPPITEALPTIRTFIGNATVIGHNVGFDLSFLYRQNILQNNLWIDTYDLASVLLPSASRYNLGSLATQVGIQLTDAHRALNDARASALLYWALWQKVLTLPKATLAEISAASQGLGWNAHAFFEAALLEPSERSKGTVTTPTHRASGSLLTESKALKIGEARTPIESAEILRIFNDGLAQKMPDYEQRPQQIEMAIKVTEAFNGSKHVMIEAGTGTGKSVAYLIPSIMWSTSNQQRIVISTNTINLQEQLISKDIPALRSALQTPFNAVVLKGRGNYLCPRRLLALRRQVAEVDEIRVLAKILVWQLESDSGDKSEINLRGPVENNIWQRLSAEDEGCTLDRCQAAMQGACPFYKARKAAEAAHLVIVNHALLVSDVLSENQVLPDYRYVVIDEAHHLEEAATNGLSFRIDQATLRRRLANVSNPKRGLVEELLNQIRPHMSELEFSRLSAFAKNVSTAIAAMEVHIKTLFEALGNLYSEINERSGDFSSQLRITPALRNQASFAHIPAIWSVLREFFDAIGEALNRLSGVLARIGEQRISNYADLTNTTYAAIHHLDNIKQELTALTQSPDSNRIYWLNMGQNNVLSLHSAPLHIGQMAEKYLWQNKETVIMTSATLQTDSGFDYMRKRLQADDFETVNVGSPFDYHKSTLVFVPDDMPDPNDRFHYQQAVERGLIELAAALDGRTMALFTSYTQLRQTAQAITPRLSLGNITVYDQIEGGNRQNLVEGFKSTEKSVLLGTRSFWEGVDIPGDSISALVITRLPFAVPTEPVFAARSETYADPFKEYTVPDAILRFRQGFGRLIRNRSDRGVVAIFDKRVISKSYGASFLEALPDCTVYYGKLEELPEVTVNWIDRLD